MKPAGAALLAFPLARRRALVKNLAGQMLERSSAQSERHLAFELRRHARILSRRQLEDRVVEAEVRALESSVRHELWRMVMAQPQPSSGR